MLQKAEKEIPDYNVPYNYISGGLDFARAYALLGQKKRANEILNKVWNHSAQYAQWYLGLAQSRFTQSQRDCMMHLSIMNQASELYGLIDKKQADEKAKTLNTLYNMYVGKGGNNYYEQ